MLQRVTLIPLLLLLLYPPISSQAEENLTGIILQDSEGFGSSPSITEYKERIARSLTMTPPVLRIHTPLTEIERQAEELALQSKDFIRHTKDPKSGKPFRNEVFHVTALNETSSTRYRECQKGGCYRVELFNFALNLLSEAIIHPIQNKVLAVNHSQNTQPEIPEYLSLIAEEISSSSAHTRELLGKDVSPTDFTMSSTKTALKRTKCERSRHLCVAPTFVQGKKALWSIVDLTDLRLVGLKWTEWGDQPIAAVTEKHMRNRVVHDAICRKSARYEQDGWSFSYMLTGSDGLLVTDVTFQGSPRLKSSKNLDWHVSYSTEDDFGYSDAAGCPLFSTAAIVPPTLPDFRPLKSTELLPSGFEIHQDFITSTWPLPCSYYYENRYQFYEDGSYRIIVANVGRGCGNNGTYRPVVRFELPLEGEVSQWTQSGWKVWKHEGWTLQNDKSVFSPEGSQFRIRDKEGNGFYVIPSQGQFGDGSRGDHAYVYITRAHREGGEGEEDTPTIGPCCNTNHEQGPEKFINTPPEKIEGQSVVFWYVPQLKNDSEPGHEYCWARSDLENGVAVKREFPCLAGPRIVPFSESSE